MKKAVMAEWEVPIEWDVGSNTGCEEMDFS